MKVDYLRLSVTDLCNLNCLYCTPLEKSQFLSHDQVLRYEELALLVELFVKAGIKKVRLTGGEPLIKRNIEGLVALLKKINGLEELSMTTNGVLLVNLAEKLKRAGLDRINISLDSLKPERFKKITGNDNFKQVWQGVEKALAVGFAPVKLNVVPMRGLNDDEIVDFAKLTLNYNLTVRFIEFFHTNQRSKKLLSSLVPSEETKALITFNLGQLQATKPKAGNGPAVYYRLKGAKANIGFISSSTSNFCQDCNRIRIDCAGRISPCLFSGYIYDIRPLLKETKDIDQLSKVINELLKVKSQHTRLQVKEPSVEMSSLGG